MSRRMRHGMDPRSVRLDHEGGRYIDQVRFGHGHDRRDRIAAQAEEEAKERVERRMLARCTGTVVRSLTVLNRDKEIPHSGREPCVQCGVRKDRHDAHGCKRWRVG